MLRPRPALTCFHAVTIMGGIISGVVGAALASRYSVFLAPVGFLLAAVGVWYILTVLMRLIALTLLPVSDRFPKLRYELACLFLAEFGKPNNARDNTEPAARGEPPP